MEMEHKTTAKSDPDIEFLRLRRQKFRSLAGQAKGLTEVLNFDDGFKFAYCENHAKEMMPLFKKKNGKPLLWMRIREKGENQSVEARLLAVFDDIKFNEENREVEP